MLQHRQSQSPRRPAGYAALVGRYHLDVIPHWHASYVSATGHRCISTAGAVTEEVYPAQYWPGDTSCDHLELALKYDGINLAILAALFERIPVQEIEDYVRSKPVGKYARRIWFLYEFTTGARLALEDLTRGNYVDLLDSAKYYTVTPAQRVRRQRVNFNMLGTPLFCPTVRRTETLRRFEAADLPRRCSDVVSGYSPELIRRAMGYLYTKETRSSFEIEHVEPSSSRADRFVALLQLAAKDDFCTERRLTELQNHIVDARFRDAGFRSAQNYVGQAVDWRREQVHYVSPKPEDLPGLMEGLVDAHRRMEAGGVPPVIHAAAAAYGFVFLHPFEDGNGRIHRFLIHNILARRGFTPSGLMFPVSASMLHHPGDYDASLEAFSRPLMPLVQYTLDEEGRMTVQNDTARWYRYMDLTPQAEALFRFIEQTIETELAGELAFLARYDRAKRAIRSLVDMPDRQMDRFIRLCVQNHGRLSGTKRLSHFAGLSDDEVAGMEGAVQAAYGIEPVGGG